ncbi:MAG: GspE/PulE family protein [Casimicrobiaceae bacterium]|nr:GspE/PulE family protein [Casimicrobiaceae bacterium]MCX8098846.1 GspE/PulE family protein [Casimicrobiaceae bacterium]MDW8311501.1 GspE/PulE family protein [Burkholderiales bacterium]
MPDHALPLELARELGVVVLEEAGGVCTVATAPHATAASIAAARARMGRPLALQPVSAERFALLLGEVYARAPRRAAEAAVATAPQEPSHEASAELLASTGEGGAVALLAELLREALAVGASDLHFDPTETGGRIRRRIDGLLEDVMVVEAATHQSLVARAKVMAGLDLAERRLPQDGRLRVTLAGRPVDVRVATLPVQYGERAVLRLLDRSRVRFELTALGMSEALVEALRAALATPHGMILITGPTGSGKTTSLYALIAELDRERLNVVTVEDPVEVAMERVAQTQVNPRIDLDFARALRSILRHDPDVIVVGEIRDRETAEIAVQASLTGHLVLASLHTNSAGAAVTRLTDMGVEPYLLASCLRGVLAQRLVRKLDPAARRLRPILPRERELLMARRVEAAALPDHLPEPVGTVSDRGGGFRGRLGIFRWLPVDRTMAEAIHARAPDSELEALASQAGWPSLLVDGLRHLRAGETTLTELLRVTES